MSFKDEMDAILAKAEGMLPTYIYKPEYVNVPVEICEIQVNVEGLVWNDPENDHWVKPTPEAVASAVHWLIEQHADEMDDYLRKAYREAKA